MDRTHLSLCHRRISLGLRSGLVIAIIKEDKMRRDKQLKGLEKLLKHANKNLKAAYLNFCDCEEELDKYDCGLHLVRQFNPKLVDRYEAYNTSMSEWFLEALRVENAIGYLLTE